MIFKVKIQLVTDDGEIIAWSNKICSVESGEFNEFVTRWLGAFSRGMVSNRCSHFTLSVEDYKPPVQKDIF